MEMYINSKNMTVTFRAWSKGYKELQSEQVSLSNLDGYNKTRYSRRKKQEGLLELASPVWTLLFWKPTRSKRSTLQRYSMMTVALIAPLSPMWDTLVSIFYRAITFIT